MPRAARAALLWLLPVALVLALQLRALDYGFVWTDEAEYVHGSVLRPPGEIAHAFLEPLHRIQDLRNQPFAQPYYRPLQVVVSSALASHFAREPRSFRSVSLALACATCALFAAFAARLLGSRAAGALAGCALAAHPGMLEIYVWVGAQSAALANFFVVLSVACGAGALEAKRRGSALLFSAGALLALALGLASKENAAVIPALLAALSISALRSGRTLRVVARRVGPLLAAELAVAVAYLLVLRPRVLGASLTGAAPIGGSAATQLATSLAHWPAALAWIFLPLASTTSDSVRVVQSFADPLVLAGIGLTLASALAWLWLLWRRHTVAAFALAWVWLAFLPTSGLVPLLHLRSERNLFLSVFGAALLLPCAAIPLRRLGASRALCAAAGVLALLFLAQRSWQRTPDWRSTRALFTRDLAADPYHREGRMNLALEALADGRPAEALPQVERLLAQRAERDRIASFLRDEALFELACLVYREVGQDAAALALYEHELAADAALFSNPGFFECLAPILERSGRSERAARVHAGLFQISRGDPRFALGAARNHAAAGQLDAARAWLARIPPKAVATPQAAQQIARIRQQIEAAAPPGAP